MPIKRKINRPVTAIYIHIPFCQHICDYCDFPKLQYFRLFAEKYLSALKKEMDISIGNIIGSNIFNICMIIGLTSCVTPLEAEANILSFDVWFLLASLLLLGITVFPIKGKTEIVRIEGIMLLLLYIGYYVAMGLTGQFAALG